MDKKTRLLDAAENLIRNARVEGPGKYLYLICAPNTLDDLEEAVKAIRPLFHMEGGRKIYDQPANWAEEDEGDMNTFYFVRPKDSLRWNNWEILAPKNGVERHRHACDILADYPEFAEVMYITPAEKNQNTWRVNRSENYTPSTGASHE